MVEYVGVEYIEPYRLLVSNKVYMMTFISKCFTKLGSQYPTSSKGRIANDSYTHAEYLEPQRNNDYADAKE